MLFSRVAPGQISLHPVRPGLELNGRSLLPFKRMVTSPWALPCFLFECSAPVIHPPLATYRREGRRVFVKPLEAEARSARLVVRDKNGIAGDFAVTGDFLLPPLRGDKAWIQMETSEGTYLFETFPQYLPGQQMEKVLSYRETRAVSFHYLLDPDGGADKLAEDIVSGKFKAMRRERMKLLLDILRCATPQQEEILFTNIQIEEPDFFADLMNHLLTENLLPYMSRNEIHHILSHAPPEVLSGIAASPYKEAYRKFFSRNQFAEVERISPNNFIDPFVWIIEEYRNKYSSWWNLPYIQIPFYPVDRLLPVVPPVYEAHWLTGGSLIESVRFEERTLFLFFPQPIRELSIYMEKRTGMFENFYFRQLSAGILAMRDLATEPRRLYFSALFADTIVQDYAVCVRIK